jgi:hypothetical protein
VTEWGALASLPHSHSNLRMLAHYVDKNSQSILWKTVRTNNTTCRFFTHVR